MCEEYQDREQESVRRVEAEQNKHWTFTQESGVQNSVSTCFNWRPRVTTYIKCITNVTYHWIIFTLKYFVLWSKVLVTQVNLYFFSTLSFVQQNRHKRWFSFVRIVILSYSSTVAAATPHFSLFVFSLQHTVWEINYKLLRKVDKFLCSVLRH